MFDVIEPKNITRPWLAVFQKAEIKSYITYLVWKFYFAYFSSALYDSAKYWRKISHGNGIRTVDISSWKNSATKHCLVLLETNFIFKNIICFKLFRFKTILLFFQASFLTEEADQPSPPPPTFVTKDSSSELKEVEAVLNEVVIDDKLPVHDAAEIRASIVRQMTMLRNLDAKRGIFDKVGLTSNANIIVLLSRIYLKLKILITN